MDREQALNTFWNSFGVKAYDENTVPDNAPVKKITYEVAVNNFGYPTAMTASIYDVSTSWKSVTDIFHQVEERLKHGGIQIPCDSGTIWIKAGTPFGQRFNGDTNDSVRRIVVNIEAEFLEV